MKKLRPQPHRPRERGVALVTTMIVVAVLAVVAVAFMQSTSTDRLSSRTALNYVQARLVAEAGAVAGAGLVADLVRRYPDSATVWQNIGGGTGGAAGMNNEATVLYVRAQTANTNIGARPAQFGGEVTLLARPLVSLQDAGRLFPIGDVAAALPATGAEMVNLNATNAGRPRPLVGLRSATNAGAPVTAAQWIYLGAQPGPTNANNPAIARYAFWVEDESFKVNVNVATNGLRGADSLGLSPAEVRLDGAWGSSTNATLRGANAGTVVTDRNGLRGSSFPTALTAAIPAKLSDEQAADELKFLTTVHSAGLDLSRGGFKRFNINSVTNGPNVRSNLNRLIAAITNTNAAPNFGQRFYRSAGAVNETDVVTGAHANIYLQKIAANIVDYIDDDDQPTIINNDAGFSLRTGRPQFGIESAGPGLSGANPVAAVGVENVPQLQEYALHARLRYFRRQGAAAEDLDESFGYSSTNTNIPTPATADYEVWLDHYFEFWNPGTRDYTTPVGTFITIWDLPRWDGASGALASDRAVTNIPAVGITFHAGAITVLTTAPTDQVSYQQQNPKDAILSQSNFVSLSVPPADRIFNGTTTMLLRNPSNNAFVAYKWPPDSNEPRAEFAANYDRLFAIELPYRPEAGIFIGNDQGIVTSFHGLTVTPQAAGANAKFQLAVSNGYIWDALVHRSFAAGNNDNVRGSSLRGNSTESTIPATTEGDPRTLNEQLEFFSTAAAGGQGVNDTRFSVTYRGETNFPVPMTFGFPNTNYVAVTTTGVLTNLTTKWVDASSLAGGSANAPLFIRNGPLQSIGELGHITDPARNAGTNALIARGGGRTLRIGQPELGPNSGAPTNLTVRWFDGNQTSASRTWTSWRLADVLTTKTNVTIPGLINPNGLLRDRGAAWRGLLHGLRMLPPPEGAINTSNRLASVTNVVNAALDRLTNTTGSGLPPGVPNIFWERGEISELPLFNTGSGLAPNMERAFDRGREEVVRRSIEMITTRGSVFTVYAVGQTLQGTNVTGVARLKQTFQIEPVFRDPADALNDLFAVDSGSIRRRFAAPTNYTVRVLATSYD